MNKIIEPLHDSAKRIFIISYVLIVVVFLSVTLFDISAIEGDNAVKASTFGILYTLLIIPLSLKGYARSIESLRLYSDEALAAARYKRATLLRMALLTSAVCIDLLIYGLSADVSMVVCALIPMASTFFCIPSKKRTGYELSQDQPLVETEDYQPE